MTMLRNLFHRVGGGTTLGSIAITAMWPARASVIRRRMRPADMRQVQRTINRYGWVR